MCVFYTLYRCFQTYTLKTQMLNQHFKLKGRGVTTLSKCCIQLFIQLDPTVKALDPNVFSVEYSIEKVYSHSSALLIVDLTFENLEWYDISHCVQTSLALIISNNQFPVMHETFMTNLDEIIFSMNSTILLGCRHISDLYRTDEVRSPIFWNTLYRAGLYFISYILCTTFLFSDRRINFQFDQIVVFHFRTKPYLQVMI